MRKKKCERCGAKASIATTLFRVIKTDELEWLCCGCLADKHYAASRGRIAQDPTDDVRPTGWDEPGGYR